MKGIVLSTNDGFIALPHQKMVFQPSRDTGGQWRATVTGHDQPRGWFGPVFATEDKARELCRAAAVALAEGTGGVFGEPVAEVQPERPLKVGDRVTHVDEGRGVVASVSDDGFVVKWDDGADDYEWADVGFYVFNADEPAQAKSERPLKVGDRVACVDPDDAYCGDKGTVTSVGPFEFAVGWDDGQESKHSWAEIGRTVDKTAEPAEAKPEVLSGPKVGMRVKIINPSDADWGDEGVVDKIYDDGSFSIAWDDGKWTPCVAADFGKWVGPAQVEPTEVKPEAPSGPKVGMRVKWAERGGADTGIVVSVHGDGTFKVLWDVSDRGSVHENAEFGGWIFPA